MEPQNSTIPPANQQSPESVTPANSSHLPNSPIGKPGAFPPLASDPAAKPLPPGIVRDSATGQLKSLPGNKLGPKPGYKAGQRSTPITDALADELARIPAGSSKTLAQLLAGKLIKIAAEDKGRLGYEAILTIMERVDGRVPIRQELSGVDGQPMQLEQVGSVSEAQTQLMTILSRIADRSGPRANTGETRNVSSNHQVIEAKREPETGPEVSTARKASPELTPPEASQPTSVRDRFTF